MILLQKRKLKSKTEASIPSLKVSAFRLCFRIKDYHSRTETTVYIILTTTNPVQLKEKIVVDLTAFWHMLAKLKVTVPRLRTKGEPLFQCEILPIAYYINMICAALILAFA